MLRVGVTGGGRAHLVRQRLAYLGAIDGADGAADPSLDEPGVVVETVEADAASTAVTHLVISVSDEAPSLYVDPYADVTLGSRTTDRQLMDLIDALWRERLVPFERNLREKRRARRRRVPVLLGPDPAWPAAAARVVARLHAALGILPLRIDHIGSTSVPGLRAKDLLDVQVTVRTLADATLAAEAARHAGFVHVEGEWFGEDRLGLEYREEVAVDADPGRPTNVNCRPVTDPVWRDALLFRDWLRADEDERAGYEAMKLDLATGPDAHVDRYSIEKMPWIRAGLERAERWAEARGWTP